MRTRLGQNFLIDNNIVRRIADACGDTAGKSVIEIGPGKGVLTEELAKRYRSVIAVELDGGLCAGLAKKFAGSGNVEIIHADFLEWDLPAAGKFDFAANIPYYISTPIVEKVLGYGNRDTAVFMVQKEVAERMAAAEGSKKRGVLSVACQSAGEVKIIFDVPAQCFRPAPEVTSSVVRFRRTAAEITGFDRKKLMEAVKASFSHRRKTISNSLALALGIGKSRISEMVSGCGISPAERPENIPIDKFLALSRVLPSSDDKK